MSSVDLSDEIPRLFLLIASGRKLKIPNFLGYLRLRNDNQSL